MFEFQSVIQKFAIKILFITSASLAISQNDTSNYVIKIIDYCCYGVTFRNYVSSQHKYEFKYELIKTKKFRSLILKICLNFSQKDLLALRKILKK